MDEKNQRGGMSLPYITYRIWFPIHQPPGQYTIRSKAVRWIKRTFDLHSAISWHLQNPRIQIFFKVQALTKLPAPYFLFDRLSQSSLSFFMEYWDRLSNYLISPSGFPLKRAKAPEQFTNYSYLVGKWCFCHCPPILARWSPYIAKYP